MEREGAKFEDVRELVAGTRGKMVYETGDPDQGIWSAGQVQGLIHDIPTCAELVSRIMRDAEAIIRGRLEAHDVRLAAAKPLPNNAASLAPIIDNTENNAHESLCLRRQRR